MTPRAITGLVDALVESGFVTSEAHPSDRRATLVTFTQQGDKAAESLESDHIEFARKLFDEMPETTFRNFTRGLDQVLARLQEHVVPRGR